MNKLSSNIIVSSIIATTAMTAFSKLAGKVDKDNFNEPVLLAELMHRLPLDISKKYSRLAGWQLHYVVGLVWAVLLLYAVPKGARCVLWKCTAFGLLSGLSAIAWWKTAFSLHRNPPKLNHNTYYLQLLAAHIVFSITACAAAKRID